MKKIRCGISLVVFIGLEIAALFYDKKWAMNILQFASPVFAICYLLIGFVAKKSSKEVEKILKTYRDGEHLPKWVDSVTYAFAVGAFADYSHFWLAACWMFICGVDFHLRGLAEEGRNV